MDLEKKRKSEALPGDSVPTPPVPSLNYIEQTGVVTVTFSQDVHIVPELSMIKDGTINIDDVELPVLQIEVKPGEDSDPSKLSFEWQLIDMTE